MADSSDSHLRSSRSDASPKTPDDDFAEVMQVEQLLENKAEPTVDQAAEPVKETGYGWLLAFASSIIGAFAIGLFSAWGIFQKEIIFEESAFQGSTNAELALVGSLAIGPVTAFGVITGVWSDKLGSQLIAALGGVLASASLLAMSYSSKIWHLYLAALLYAFGSSMSLSPSLAVTPQWFGKWRGVAVGINAGGVGLGGLVFPPLVQWLIDGYGWSVALRVLAVLALILMTGSGAIIRPRPKMAEIAARRAASKQATTQDGTTPSSPSSLRMFLNLLRNPLFVLIFASPMLCGWSFFAPQSYVPQALADGGYSSSVGAGMVAAIGGVNMVGRVVQGRIGDYLGTLNSLLLSNLITGLSALIFWLSGPTHIITVSLMSFFWGYANGGVIVALPIVAATYFPPEHAGLVTGALFSGFFIPDMVGPIVAGATVDAYTTYTTDSTSADPVRVGTLWQPLIVYVGAMWILGAIPVVLARRHVLGNWKIRVKL